MLKVWKTPFMSHSFPSVWFSVDTHLGNVNVFVKGDRRWRVRFDHIAGLKICDENYDRNTRFHIKREQDGLCSYTWEYSPWLEEFEIELVETVEEKPLYHYVLLGGDHNVEVLALGNVEIEPAT